MDHRTTVASVCYGITAGVSAIMGSLYLVWDRFMPYHAAAMGHDWQSLAPEAQTLFLALMRVAAGGWLAVALAVALLWSPFRAGQIWARLTIPLVLLIFYLPNLWATLSVTWYTPANAPWYGNAAAVVATVVGAAVDAGRPISDHSDGANRP